MNNSGRCVHKCEVIHCSARVFHKLSTSFPPKKSAVERRTARIGVRYHAPWALTRRAVERRTARIGVRYHAPWALTRRVEGARRRRAGAGDGAKKRGGCGCDLAPKLG